MPNVYIPQGFYYRPKTVGIITITNPTANTYNDFQIKVPVFFLSRVNFIPVINGRVIPYCLENSDGRIIDSFSAWDWSYIWFLIDKIQGGESIELRLYKFDFIEKSFDPNNVLLIFDDFNGNSLNTKIWKLFFGTFQISNSLITFSGSGAHAIAGRVFSNEDIKFECLAKYVSGRPMIQFHNTKTGGAWQYAGWDNYASGGGNRICMETGIGGTCTNSAGCFTFTLNNFHLYGAEYVFGQSVSFYIDNEFKGTINSCLPNDNLTIGLGTVSGTVIIDWIKFYKLTYKKLIINYSA